ncbi:MULTISPECIES: glycosyltransferase family 2 protein [Rhizobium]|uniref:Glycosyltransferase involved in cell wall bisynthesis n=1 Tax=Rhizobium miluonense TaxID=411945 RepID=A0A1C3WMI8_9HYPH|nr:glycosyltransferase family A protein [Rhizobium miluonense]SCB41201.1 Glycosyltransferase involved in cell wall bisynthesis [Rhizobium miluonense]
MALRNSEILLSIVIATLGRTHEIERLLKSLAAQKVNNFEIIVVDQNNDDRLGPILEVWSDKLPITRKRAESRGVCRARNLGATFASGEWLLFPDDDCWYPEDFVSQFDTLRAVHPSDFYSGRPVDLEGNTIMGTFEKAPTLVDRKTVWTTLIEWAIVIRRSSFEEVEGFAGEIGPGAGTRWGGYEVQDIALKLLKAGYQGYYVPTLVGHHPEDLSDRASPGSVAKIRAYSVGMGYVMRKHDYSLQFFLPHLVRPLMGVVVYTLSGKPGLAKRSREIFSGRWSGWNSVPAFKTHQK